MARAAKPKPGSAAYIRLRTAELESATALLKEARPIIERLEGELGLDDKAPAGNANGLPTAAEADDPDLDYEINDVVIWTSLAAFLCSEMRFPKEMSEGSADQRAAGCCAR